MQKKYFIAFCLILFIISIAVVSASDIEQTDADTDVLSVSNEYKLSNGVDSGTFDELQKKINNASEGSTIEFFNNYTYDDTFEAKGIMINKSLTIEGNGFTIDGANKARIFFIDATNNITLNNIVFKNAISPEGSAILFNKSIENITISNSVFSNNIVPNDGHGGGAISFNNDVSGLLFENDTFENNYAPLGYGGSIVFDGNTTNVTFNSSTFRVNKPREKDITGGGAIYFVGDAVLISIDNCEFDNITARTGGAIYVEGSFDTSLIHNTKFTNNKAFTDNLDYGGGAIAVEGNASSILIFNSDFINNTAKTHGGAIKFMANDELNTFDGCIFYNNYAPYGGAVALGNTDYLVISESSFTNHIGAEDDIHKC